MAEVLVLGGDGFCGWPTSLHLADRGDKVTIVDNLSHRRIDGELGVESLTPIAGIDERLEAWERVAGLDKKIDFVQLDIAQDYDGLVGLLDRHKPDTVVHFAEQRAAPYSMKSSREKRYTVDNNVNATHNLLAGLVEAGVDAHVVHLGTMGVYGYGQTGSLAIPEGYLDVWLDTPTGQEKLSILHPTKPGSVYHLTKVLDQSMLEYYARNDGIRVTDLHQGIVWGTQTPQTVRDDRLINRFDYDGNYGTVLNRFLMQAAVDYPLTVHGSGGQTRAFINIKDTARCVELASQDPPARGERPKIHNQMTEVYKLRDLARMVSDLTGADINYIDDNPRNEAAENELVVDHDHLKDLGLEPTTLSDGLIEEITDIARKYSDRADISKIPATSRWVQRRD